MSVKKNLVSRLTRTRLLFPLLLIVLLLPALYFYATRPKETAAWWDESWVYRKRIDISNPGGSDLTDFQVSFTLDTTDTSKFKSNCADLRITGVDGNLLPFWIEENNPGCGDASTKVWVKIPSIPSSGTYIYAYYGNPSASVSSDHDGEKVFDFFENMEDWSNWTTYSSGLVSQDTTRVFSGSYSAHKTTNSDPHGAYKDIGEALGRDIILEFMVNRNSVYVGGDADRVGLIDSSGNGYGWFYNNSNDTIGKDKRTSYSGTYTTSTATAGYMDSWVKAQLVIASDGTITVRRYSGDTLIGEHASTDSSYSSFTRFYILGGYDYWIDQVTIRKYTTTEPSTTTQSEEIGPGPIAYWKFDEGTGSTVNDSSSNAHHGTISGATWQTEDQCVSGKCIYFDGTNDYIDTNWDFDMGSDISTSFSIWIKPVTVDTGGKVKTILGKIDYQYALYQLDQKLYFQAWTSAEVNTIAYQTNNILNTNQWTQVTFIHNGSEHKSYFYINGTLYGSANDTAGTFKNVSESMKIGRGYGWGGSTTPYFNGFIDELKVFPYARTADQALQDYNQYANSIGDESSSLSNGLVGYWKMDEASWNGTSNEVIDSSGNNNHATSAYGANVTTGKYGNAGNFDGTDDQVDTTATNLFPYTNNFTISAWVKPTTLAHARIAGHAGTAKGFGLGIRSTGAIWLVTQSVKDYVTTTTPITTNSWQLLTAVMDSNNDVSFYLNGTFIEKVTHTSPAVANTDTVFRIGQWNSTYKFTGSIDEVRVYNRALSASEVSSLYHYAPGPVGYWKLDEAQGTTANDSSGYGLTSSSFLGSPDWTTGKYGSALNFQNSGDYLSIADNSLLKPSNITVEAWVYPTTNFVNWTAIATKTTNGSWSDGYGLVKSGTGNIIRFFVNNYNSGSSGDATLALNTWSHVAGTYDGSTIKLYVNGTLINSASYSTPLTNSTQPLLIGRGAGSNGYRWIGKIDDIRIYNYARSAEQIRQDMAGTSNPNTSSGSILPQPILHWKLDEGKGTTINDSSSNNYTGTIGCAGTGCTLPTWKNDGKINKAVYFYDVDPNRIYITRSPINISSTTGSKMTWTTWIKPNATQNGGGWFLRNGNGADQNYGLNLGALSNGYYRLSFTGYDTTFRTITTTNYIIPASQWSHLAVTYSQGEWIKVYVNGEFKEQVTWSYSPTVQSTSEFAIGGHQGSTGQRFNGYLDEFKVYNSELTINQVKQDMNSGSTLAVGTTTSEAADLSDGEGNPPIAEWKLDEAQGGTAYDTSGNNKSGTITGATWNAWCKQGGCLSFDGNDNISVSNFTGLGNTSFTLQGWIYVRSQPSVYSSMVLSSGSGFVLYLSQTNRYPYAQLYNGTGWTPVSCTNINASLNSWHHLALTYDDSTTSMTLYYNGQKCSGPTSISGGFYDSYNTTIQIGAYLSSYFHDGLVDHVKIYNYARTPAQIAYDYNRGEPIAHWKMDECQGSTINDASGNSNQGTLTIGGSGSQTSIGSCPTSGAWGNGSSGKFNSSISLDGTDDYISINRQNLNVSTFSLSMWIKPDAVTDESFLFFNAKDGAQWCGWGLAMDRNSIAGCDYGDICLWISENCSSAQYQYIDYPHDFTVGTWSHLAVTFNASNKETKFYINGDLKHTETASRVPAFDGTAVTAIGKNATNWFDGQLDDIRVYNYVLSEAQIQKVMNEGSSLRFGE